MEIKIYVRHESVLKYRQVVGKCGFGMYTKFKFHSLKKLTLKNLNIYGPSEVCKTIHFNALHVGSICVNI